MTPRSSKAISRSLLIFFAIIVVVAPHGARAFEACWDYDIWNGYCPTGYGVGAEAYLSASAYTISPGQSVYLYWSGDGYPGYLNGTLVNPWSGAMQVNPTQTTTYTLSSYGSSGYYNNDPSYGSGAFPTSPVQSSVTITVLPTSCSMSASPSTTAVPGAAAGLGWSTSNASSFSIDNGIGSQPLSGTYTVYPSYSTTYTGTATAPGGGSVSCQATVAVAPAPEYYLPNCPSYLDLEAQPGFSGASLDQANSYVNNVNYGPNPLGGSGCFYEGSQCYLNDTGGSWMMSCDPVPEGQCTETNSCGQSNTGWTINGSGCTVAAPANPGYYGQSCTSVPNACGQTNTGTYNCSDACTASTPANPSYYGQSCTSAPNACGQTNTGTYNCSQQCSASTPSNANCAPTVTLTSSPTTIVAGNPTTLTWTSSNATSCTAAGGFSTGGATSGSVKVTPSTTSNYQISCSGPGGTAPSNISTVTVEQPTASITATPVRVVSGGTSNISWSASNVNSCSITKNGAGWRSNLPANGSGSVSGSSFDTITTLSTYVITCSNTSQSVAAQVSAQTMVTVVPMFQYF